MWNNSEDEIKNEYRPMLTTIPYRFVEVCAALGCRCRIVQADKERSVRSKRKNTALSLLQLLLLIRNLQLNVL